jgi:hypothetical protein
MDKRRKLKGRPDRAVRFGGMVQAYPIELNIFDLPRGAL